MNPSFYDESPPAPGRVERLVVAARKLASVTRATLRFAYRVLTYDPLAHFGGGRFRAEDGSAASRVVRGLMYRLAFVPLMIACVACGIVWFATHPTSITAELDPASDGLYFDAIQFPAADGTQLQAWLIPTIDAKAVIEGKDHVLRSRFPAAVLAHDIGRRREQMLPLIKPLHDAGFVVLAVNLRGDGNTATRGAPRAECGETFGLTEASDLHVAVEMLRRRTFVDPARISLVGFGTGATASLICALQDGRISRVVAEAPIRDTSELVKDRLMPGLPGVGWLSPLCKWTFEIAYGVDAEDVELSRFRKLREAGRAMVELNEPSFDTKSNNAIVRYLQKGDAIATAPIN